MPTATDNAPLRNVLGPSVIEKRDSHMKRLVSIAIDENPFLVMEMSVVTEKRKIDDKLCKTVYYLRAQRIRDRFTKQLVPAISKNSPLSHPSIPSASDTDETVRQLQSRDI